MKNVLIIVFNGLKTDARVLKQIAVLHNNYRITAVSYQDPQLAYIEHVTIPKPNLSLFDKIIISIFLKTRLYRKAYWLLYRYGSLKEALNRTFDLIIANDIEAVPLAFYIRGKGEGKIIFDAHEYAPRQFENQPTWRFLFKKFNTYLCRYYIPQVDRMITQNRLFAAEYLKEFGVKPSIMTNAPDYHSLDPSVTDSRQIKIIHHGIYNQVRNLERLLDIIDALENRFYLYLMIHLPLSANDQTRSQFNLFKQRAKQGERVTWVEPVGGEEVVKEISRYDVGLHILEPINFNHQFSLPNKMLEFIQARLAVIIGPSPGMVDIVDTYKVGCVTGSFDTKSFVDTINSLTVEQIDEFKRHSHSASLELSSESNKKVLEEIVSELLQ